MKLHKIDNEARLYVLHTSTGFSCLGFDVLDRRARAMAREVIDRGTGTTENMVTWLALLDSGRPNYAPGTEDHFEVCSNVYDYAQINASVFGPLRCDLHPALLGREGRRIEAIVNGQKRRFNVGRSTGWCPCHLFVHNRRSRGGDAVSVTDTITNVREVSP